MADKKKVSEKHLKIDKDQTTMLAVIALSVAVVIFSLFATKSMVTKGLYQKRALSARKEVVTTLKKNYDSAQTLFTQYKVFAEDNPNILGGSNNGNTNLDGSNPVLVLDSLPSVYDAPALAASIEKVMSDRNVTIKSLSLTDDPTTYPDDPQATPQAKAVTFSFQGETNYDGASKLLSDFERSIRAFDVTSIEISGSDTKLKLNVSMNTYYQPAKSLNLTATKVVQ